MLHCTPEQLALAALAEPLPAADAAHLESCARCSAEVASLRRPVEVLTVPPLTGGAPEVAPPPQVWAAIAAATGVSAAPHPAAPDPAAPHPAVPRDPASRPDDVAAPVVQLRPRRSLGRWLPLVAAVLVGVGVGAGAMALDRDDTGDVVAATALDPLDAADASGRAEVRESGGVRELQVDLDAPELDDGYYEVWLLQPDAVRMVPVGVVHRGDTVLPLPAGLDLGDYPVVDVSVEPIDGDPTHSGVSVARGELS